MLEGIEVLEGTVKVMLTPEIVSCTSTSISSIVKFSLVASSWIISVRKAKVKFVEETPSAVAAEIVIILSETHVLMFEIIYVQRSHPKLWL